MNPFVYNGLPCRAIFGAGLLAQLPEEVERLGARRVLIVSTSQTSLNVQRVEELLGDRVAGIYGKATMHVPFAIAEEARDMARKLGADCCVTIGGGSTIGLGKAVALTSNLPIISVPTTYAGSEMTSIYGLTNAGMKTTGRDARVLPKTVIYDPVLTLTLPSALSAASGMNAIAHCAEALYAHDGNPIISMMAEEGIRALSTSLPIIVKNSACLEARSEALYGAWLAGIALGSTGMALHHKLCHVLGGSFNLPHAKTHSIVLPHAMRYNRDAAPAAMARIARALGVDDAPTGLYNLGAKLGLTLALKDIGMTKEGLEHAAKTACNSPYPNPRAVEFAATLALLSDAYEGRRPQD